jgi:hypothetical protein
MDWSKVHMAGATCIEKTFVAISDMAADAATAHR